tara:strand:- start:2966 stop:3100 length:135 start_codon:yes stop_codon:yes gene_type:complete
MNRNMKMNRTDVLLRKALKKINELEKRLEILESSRKENERNKKE